MVCIIYFIGLTIVMYSMISELKKNKQKLELKPIIITAYIIQCIGILCSFDNISVYNSLSLDVIFQIIGFCIFAEVAFIFVLWQYIKFNKNKGA